MNRGLARSLGVAVLLGLTACGGSEVETPGAATQRGIDRSVADIQAADAATRGPVEVSRSVGELTGKATADKGTKPPAPKGRPEPAPAAG